MEEIKPTWKIAAQVSWLHTRIASRITSALLLIVIIVGIIILLITGHKLTLSLLIDYFLHYRKIIIPVILIIHFIPVNLYAVTKVLQHQYPSFKISVFKSHGAKDPF